MSGRVPAFAGADQRGRPTGSAALADRVYLIAALGDGASEASRLAALVALQRRLGHLGVRLSLVTLARAGSDEAIAELRRAIAQAGGDLTMSDGDCGGSRSGCGTWIAASGAPPPLPPAGRALLVDGDGGARGDYSLDEIGLDEVFHRSQHVMSLKRIWR